MRPFGTRKWTLQRGVVVAAAATIAVHLCNASLFHLQAPPLERVAWAALSLAAVAVVAFLYAAMEPAQRGALALAAGLPAFLFGLAVHGAHVVQLGFRASDFTGIPMLLAGFALTAAGSVTLLGRVRPWWGRLLLLPPVVVVVLFGLFPVGLGIYATNVAHVACCAEDPADRGFTFEDVSFATAEGRALSAWYIPSRNGAAVITVHGAGSNRATVLDEAAVLARHGYGVLMVDLEGFGGSEGRANAFGWVGARDVHAAVDYLLGRPDVEPGRIGGLGLSMGGEVLLQASGESHHLRAIVAEGATGRTAADFRELSGPLHPAFVIHTVTGLTMRLISGESPPPPLKTLVQSIAPRDVLLIAADIGEEKELMGLYKELGGPSFELWTIPEPRHVGAFDLHPDEYEQRVIAFFDSTLLGTTPLLGSR